MTPLAIVGGGPAGLATAIHAAQRGMAAVVLDRGRLPLDKACGEGLMPPGVAALAAMGVEVPAWGRLPFIGIRWVDGELVAEGRFRDRPGWGVRRTALVEGMVARAQALGVELRYGCTVRSWRRAGHGEIALDTDAGPLRARLLVGADGLRSRVRREAGLAGREGARRRFGVRRHFRVAPWSPFVEVHWQRRAEAYVTPVGADRVGVAMLWDGSGGRFEDLLGRFPALCARLEGATVETDARGAGPFAQRVRRRYAADVALVGDAAGYVDALTGEGLTLAFHAAEALAETVARGRHLRDYEAAYRRLSRTYYRATALLLHVARRPWLRRRVVRALARDPRLFDRLLAVNTGQPALAALGVGGVLRTIAGVLG